MRRQRGGPTPRKRWQPLQRGVTANPQQYIDNGLTIPDAVYLNDLYSVFVRKVEPGALHISFHRHDRKAIRDWRHMQAIKNEVAGSERMAIEVFPPESQLVDSANEYHLWVLPEGYPLAFWTGDPVVMTQEQSEAIHGKSKARQRPWQPGLSTGLGIGT